MKFHTVMRGNAATWFAMLSNCSVFHFLCVLPLKRGWGTSKLDWNRDLRAVLAALLTVRPVPETHNVRSGEVAFVRIPDWSSH